MIKIVNKNSLIEYLIANLPRKAIVRSLLQNGAECLGGFTAIPPSGRPGWIVRTTSRNHKMWIMAVTVLKEKPGYGIRILSKVPWEFYCGGSNDLYQGDSPSLYKTIKKSVLRIKNEKSKDL